LKNLVFQLALKKKDDFFGNTSIFMENVLKGKQNLVDMFEKKDHVQGHLIAVKAKTVPLAFVNVALSLKLFRPDEEEVLAIKTHSFELKEQNITTLLLSYLNVLLDHVNRGHVPVGVLQFQLHPDMRITADIRFAHVSEKVLAHKATFTDMCIEFLEDMDEYEIRFVVSSEN
jgi:hypothetical protein